MGTCLDIGAYHPFRFNNTAYFWMCGWRCVNVDANPNSIKLFNKHRSNDTNIHAAVITQKEYDAGKREIDLLLPVKQEKHGLSALGTGLTSQAPKDHVSITVPSTTVMNLLEQQGLQDISYINIDVEGYDEAVLLDIDLNRYRPMVITVEQFAEDVIDVVNGEAARYMREHNYHFHSRASFTSVFVKANGT
ncbi:MAG: FkbM family methyltransferase [Burkholderiaceae bacterium]|nr:FkbM family methyltransferase [Burkholderiaceae bacterium]